MQIHILATYCKIVGVILIAVYAYNWMIFTVYPRLVIEHAGGDIAASLIKDFF